MIVELEIKYKGDDYKKIFMTIARSKKYITATNSITSGGSPLSD